jgi:hypothetical protein
VDGRFWYPRFRLLRPAVPNEVLLAWPEFLVEGIWVDTSELFGNLDDLREMRASGFTNADGGETLFEAIACTAVDWDGRTSEPSARSACDLSANVLVDLGRFPSRDALFMRYGQTMSWPARSAAEAILGRWKA